MNLKQDVGYKAAEEVKDGQILGLGTGSTTHYFIEKVGMRVKEEEIEVMGIPTSYQSALLAQQWNIPITSLDEYSIDLAVDGADEIDPNLNLIKGGGAAHTLEKIVDQSVETNAGKSDEGVMQAMLERIFGGMPEDYKVQVLSYGEMKWHCDCSEERIEKALMSIGKKDLTEIIEEDGQAELTCQFCLKKYHFTKDHLLRLLEEIR